MAPSPMTLPQESSFHPWALQPSACPRGLFPSSYGLLEVVPVGLRLGLALFRPPLHREACGLESDHSWVSDAELFT